MLILNHTPLALPKGESQGLFRSQEKVDLNQALLPISTRNPSRQARRDFEYFSGGKRGGGIDE